jgi:hypothetical protein
MFHPSGCAAEKRGCDPHAAGRPLNRLSVRSQGDKSPERHNPAPGNQALLRMAAGHVATPSRILQRKCACGGSGATAGGCEECQSGASGSLQRQAAPAAPAGIPGIADQVLRQPGSSLDGPTRSFMEQRFREDFGAVRIHTDAKASASARAVNAHAYTVGRDVVFAQGQYAPTSLAGRRLIAHELAHVVQQRAAPSGRLQRQSDVAASNAEEEAADAAAAAVTGAAEENEIAADAGHDADPLQKGGPKKITSCDRKILAEGSCADLVAGSRYLCCDSNNGVTRSGKTKDIEGTPCPDQKFTPVFTCDNTCSKALEKGCSDSDNWMAIPGKQFARSKCGDIYTICANGKQAPGYVRDKSETDTRYEVSPGIQTALGVTVGSSFMGAIYGPKAKAAAIEKDGCCNS